MTNKTIPVHRNQPDSIVSQILADCEDVSRNTAISPQAVSRRRFLKSAIGAGVLSGTIAQIRGNALAQISQSPLDKGKQKPLVPVVEATSEAAWEGNILNEQVVSEMIDLAMVKLTGRDSAKEAWKDFVLPDDIVGIKINTLAGKELSTQRIVIDKIIEGLYGAGVLKNQIIVWDRFATHLINAGYVINQGNQDVRVFASDSVGVGYDDEVFYETEKDSEVRREAGNTKSRYSRILTKEANVIINVPIMKHHAISGVSGCLKNLAFGSVDNTRRFHPSPLHCDPAITEIFDHRIIKNKVVLNIVDGLLASFDGGPVFDPSGKWEYGGLLVSKDAVALDHLVLQTIGEKRDEMGLPSVTRLANHIRSSWRAGIGTNDVDDMDFQQVKV